MFFHLTRTVPCLGTALLVGLAPAASAAQTAANPPTAPAPAPVQPAPAQAASPAPPPSGLPSTSPTPPSATPPPGAAATSTPPAEAAATPAAPSGAPAPYSLPWQLRGIIPSNVIRSDTAFDAWKDPVSEKSAFTAASFLLVSVKINDTLAPFARFGWVVNSPPAGSGGSPIINPALGALYGRKLGDDLRLGASLAISLPVGQGGGNSPDSTHPPAIAAGIAARSFMDNTVFGVNDLGFIGGLDFAYIHRGFTAQAEVSVMETKRVRGEKLQADSNKVNSTFGLHLGYFLLPQLSLGGEIRGQIFLSTPKSVEADGNKRQQFSFAVGPRGHFKLGDGWIRPGLAFAMPIDKPAVDAEHTIVQLDIPIAF